MDNVIKIIGNSKILKYEGNEGLLQVTLNSLNAKKELLIYETSYASLNDFLERNKAEEIRYEFLKRGIKIRQLTNQPYHESYTKVEGFHEKVMQIRYIDSNKLKLDTELLIYKNIVAFYKLKPPIYAVEIYNRNFSRMQKQIFEFVWRSAEKPIIGKDSRTSIF